MDLNNTSQMQWDGENENLINSFQPVPISNRESFMTSTFSPTGVSSSGMDAYSPNYGEFNGEFEQSLSPYLYQQQNYSPYGGYMLPSSQAFLEIREQPDDNFRLRYETEMHGPHGTIKGMNSAGKNGKSKSYPTVVLHNYSGTSEVVIKCSLYQKGEDGRTHRLLHPHKLTMRPASINIHDPHYVKVSKQNNFTAIFVGLGIIQTKRPEMFEILVSKLKKERKHEKGEIFVQNEMESIKAEAKVCTKKKVDINQVALGFTAFAKATDKNEWIKISETVYSNIINNGKYGKLTIARMSTCQGEAKGDTEIFMFVTKVDKSTIGVRFYETNNEQDDGQVVWEANGIFTPSDVHHQFGIILKSPPYHNQEIEFDVNVFVQLYRKDSLTKGSSETSNPVRFTYTPNRYGTRKRARLSCGTSFEEVSSPSKMPCFPGTSNSQMTQNYSSNYQEEDCEIEHLLLTVKAEDFKLKFSDISSIVRDLRGDLEIDAIVPCSKDEKTITALEKLKMNEKIFEVLVKSTNGDTYAFADLVEKGKIEDIETFTVLIAKYKLENILNSKNDVDQSILHISILNGYFNMFKVFLKLGVDANQSDAFGFTPLHLAVLADSQECLNALLAIKNLDIDKTNDKGETPLSLSVLKNKIGMTKSLINAGANPSKINTTNGFNCLHAAVNSVEPSLEMIRFLTEYDQTMLFVESNGNKNVLQLAVKNGLAQEIIDYLATFQRCDEEFELDEICLRKMCEIFDSNGNWKIWATLMDIDHFIEEWEMLESPSRALFEYLKNSKKSLEDLIGLLEFLNDEEKDAAMGYIDEMIARKFDK